MNSLSKVTSALGWSKPDVGSGGCNQFVTRNSDAYATNYLGTDAGNYLSAEPSAFVTPHRMLSVRGEDEMSFDFIKQQWSYLASFSFNTMQTQGTEIYNQVVCPQYFASNDNYTTLGGTQAVYQMTPLCWMANVFLQWRGPIRFRFVLCKTGFHAGQLQVSFTPTTSTVSFANDQYLPRTIIDIQKGNEFCFDCPYVLNNPLIQTSGRSGTLSMKVVNTLTAPDSVNSAIVLLVFVRGLEDTMFSKPSTNCPIPCWEPQGNEVEEEGDICSGGVLGNGTQTHPSRVIEQYTVGQKLDSVLQLCKVFTPLVGNDLGAYPTPPTSTQNIYFDPHYMGACAITGAGPTYGLLMSYINGDYLSRFAGLYLFHRGGVKIKVKCATDQHVHSFLLGYNTSSSPDYRVGDRASFPPNNIHTVYTSEDSSVSHIAVVPQYSQYYGYPKTHYQDGGSISDQFAGQTTFGVTVGPGSAWSWGEFSGLTIHRAAAEDFSFHMFLGIPSVILNPVV